MAFHVPFNQRPSGQNPLPGPIFIGFEAPAPPRRKFNWWGFNGMWMSFASLFTAGFLSPIPLIVSLKGLRRPGKKMATVGTVVSLLGVALASLISFGVYNREQIATSHRESKQRAVQTKKFVVETEKLVKLASLELLEYQATNNGEFPNDVDANMLVIKHVDPWGVSLRFDQEEERALVRSAGPDKKFYSKDDVKVELSGKTESKLLPVNEDLIGKASEKVETALEKASEKVGKVSEKAADAIDKAAEKVGDALEKAAEKSSEKGSVDASSDK